MQENLITVTGNVVDDPKLRVTKSGVSVTNFRIASTPRRYDESQRAFVDSPTLFMNVSVWRRTAENVCASLHRGEPIIVSGRLCQRTYEVDETVKVAYEIAATSVGHDLSRGRTEFTKAWTPSPATSVAADSDGLPADDSALWHDTLSDDERAGAEGDTPTPDSQGPDSADSSRSSAGERTDELSLAARPLVPVA